MISKTIFVNILFIFIASSVAAQTQNIRNVDFRNFTFDTGDGTDLTLTNGRYQLVEGNKDSGEIGKIIYTDLDGDKIEDAVILIDTEVDGSMISKQDYFVYAMRDGKPKQILHEWRPRGESLRVRGKSVVIVAPYYAEGDADCCPSKTATEFYAWRKKKFVRISHKLVRREQ